MMTREWYLGITRRIALALVETVSEKSSFAAQPQTRAAGDDGILRIYSK